MRSVAAVVALAACLHAGLWAYFQTTGTAPNVPKPLTSVSYAPFEGISHPDDAGSRPTEAQIRADLKAIAPYTQNVRTYSSTGGLEMVPAIAAEFGLRVTLGVWVDKNEERTEREIASALTLARRNSNINAIVVGNETILRAEHPEQALDDIVKLIQRVKRQSPVPVTTGETWDVWLDYPKLASAVDFIAAHILPYWDHIPSAQAVDHALGVFYRLRQAHPGTRIVIAEFGWPSAGYNRGVAEPGRQAQATVLRQFVTRADALGIDYNVIEAYDQPW
jgi:exo-beta-1,3-glucanase (GH17 family)